MQYNTCYWALVKSGRSPQEAQAELKVSTEQPPAIVLQTSGELTTRSLCAHTAGHTDAGQERAAVLEI
jgi:Thg1 C terminal domain